MDRLLAQTLQPSAPAKHRRLNGFTLIEVMVALVILTVTLTSIYKLQAGTVRMSTDARFYTMAPMLAQLKLAEIEREGLEDAVGGADTFGDPYPGYAWSLQVEALETELIKSANYHLVRIDLTITYNEALEYDLRTYRFYSDE
ncbi:MAG: prepilin-type N-terminal cleavage/methylation domain-containing protein [Desulfatitalea sp.]|nr:prepilin-type N-terminal cleavage/methylation domain-containing protein [Desulfatitalea sp.]NNK01426.1 prepilin-type N-terminal cleavage/methylation domain-containing protein [Desulfatitalea sp.]